MDAITLIIVVGGLIAYFDYRLMPMLVEKVKPSKPLPLPEPDTFYCYYCGHLFPASQREKLGEYEYCPTHGSRRKLRFLENYKPEKLHDQNIRVRPADSRSEQSDIEQLPWAR